jgi:hypothetical protein
MGAVIATLGAMVLICLATARSTDIKIMRKHPKVIMIKRLCMLIVGAVIALFLWPRP